jgi:hypothetical protein
LPIGNATVGENLSAKSFHPRLPTPLYLIYQPASERNENNNGHQYGMPANIDYSQNRYFFAQN